MKGMRKKPVLIRARGMGTVYDYMWYGIFKRQWEKIPRNRSVKAVIKLQRLIIKMFLAGYKPAHIAVYVKKDNQTVRHHLQVSGYIK